jgi:dTDP-4-amino-4,6-dideoxy-D-galactose acyltransferase
MHELLDWDSSFFGVNVARLVNFSSPADVRSSEFCAAREQGIKLLYVSAVEPLSSDFTQLYGGELVDIKTTYQINFAKLDLHAASLGLAEPCSDLNTLPLSELEDLAVQSGEYSRFAIDHRIPRERFEALYKIWIRRSLNKEIAFEVLTISDADRVAGLITLGEKNGKADIGLLAVGASFRGKGYGQSLIHEAHKRFVIKGYKYGQVVTQGNNLAACNLYKKCGYEVGAREYFYHFWL